MIDRTWHSRGFSLIPVAVIIAVTLFGATFLSRPRVSHAQLSCDDPPFDTSNISREWDKTDFCKYQDGVLEEIIRGCFGRDCIPAIHSPEFEPIDAASDWLQPQSPVIAVQVEGVARAYPLAIMTRHEIVNDVMGDTPVAVTFCPLCNSALVFNRDVDGNVLRFGVSGLLRNSDLIMWDDLTQTWWQQLLGVGIVGEYTGTQLEILPSQMVSFGAFVEQYPDGEVLDPGGRNYGSNPYTGYDSSSQPFLFRGTPDARLFATERVLAGTIAGEPMAYPFDTLAAEQVVNDVVGGREVVVFWQPGATSALDGGNIDDSRDVGMAALYQRELDGEVLTFSIDDDGTIRDDQTDSVWNVFGTAIEGELAGSQLRQELAQPHFWFAWAAFSPDTEVYGLE